MSSGQDWVKCPYCGTNNSTGAGHGQESTCANCYSTFIVEFKSGVGFVGVAKR